MQIALSVDPSPQYQSDFIPLGQRSCAIHTYDLYVLLSPAISSGPNGNVRMGTPP